MQSLIIASFKERVFVTCPVTQSFPSTCDAHLIFCSELVIYQMIVLKSVNMICLCLFKKA